MTSKLRLRAGDAEDLAVIAACLQDARVTVREMVFSPDEQRFAAAFARYRREAQADWSTCEGLTECPSALVFEGIESALLTAARKKLGSEEELTIRIDRESGELTVYDHNQKIIPIDLGRIAAQTAKQVIIQKIREAESDVIFSEFESRERTIITGTVQRFEGPNIIVNLGRVEGIVPKHEQVRGEVYHPGDRIRGYVYEVRKVGSKVRVRLSRTTSWIRSVIMRRVSSYVSLL